MLRILFAGLVLALASPAWGRDNDQGFHANRTGKSLEAAIRERAAAQGYAVLPHARWQEMGEPEGEFLLTDAPFTNLYGAPAKTEFVLRSAARRLVVRIEAKWQSVPGSVDEKLPFLYLNAVEAMPEARVVVVIDGPGWRPGAVEWLRRAAAQRRYGGPAEKRVEILTLAEFAEWLKAP